MIQKPAGYDEAQIRNGEYETLELGGHICIIKDCKVVTTSTGKQQLSIAYDIDQSDPQKQGGFYARQFEGRKQQHGAEAKWPGTTRVGIDGNSVPYFKGFITSIMESNPGYVWRWDETTLKGKKFGGVFGEEEYLNKDNVVKTSVKLRFIRSIDFILNGVEVPELKKLSGNTVPNVEKPSSSSAASYFANSTEIDDSEALPF